MSTREWPPGVSVTSARGEPPLQERQVEASTSPALPGGPLSPPSPPHTREWCLGNRPFTHSARIFLPFLNLRGDQETNS